MANEIIVIACAKGKRNAKEDTGRLQKENNTLVEFVAHPGRPGKSSLPPGRMYARPDDEYDKGKTWRDLLVECNQKSGSNPYGLLKAWKLYTNPIYAELVKDRGTAKVFILSAGWGLVKSDFLLPYYDITFTPTADELNRRDYAVDGYFRDFNDLCPIPEGLEGPIVFFGGKDYLPLFCKLTESSDLLKVVFHIGKRPSLPPGYKPELYVRTDSGQGTWYFQCASDFIEGKIQI